EELNQIIDDELRREAINSLQSFNIDQVIYMTNRIVDSILAQNEIMVDLTTLDTFDHDTYSHSIDVCVLATTCGVGLGMNTRMLSDLAVAGALHDIGKQGIPLTILNKVGELTDEEKIIIESHPKIGYDMLYNRADISSFVRSGIMSHHENWDGGGYPNGLVGEEIPMFGRILHVVDVYDALIKKRVYKSGFKHTEAIEFLMGNCNRMFDIRIVETFLKYVIVYPVGTDVLLSTGEKAHVIKNRSSSVLRPVVMTKDRRILDLAKDPKCFNIVILQ
nr:HD-GYP domain-containing protein [Lachnospiraceae bacterium]